MNKAINRLRLFFCTFSGEDDYIIRECKPRIQISFALIGLFVMIVFAGCWVSASSFMSELFEGSGKWLSIPIGILWALLVANMYLLLLYTVSPTLLPVAKKEIRKGKKEKIVIETLEEKRNRNLLHH
jgi:nitric oxide reductase large subunit